jgi:hypothetical protein
MTSRGLTTIAFGAALTLLVAPRADAQFSQTWISQGLHQEPLIVTGMISPPPRTTTSSSRWPAAERFERRSPSVRNECADLGFGESRAGGHAAIPAAHSLLLTAPAASFPFTLVTEAHETW